MMDVLYLIGTLVFFGLMLAYVRAFESRGQGKDLGQERTP